MAKVSTSVYFTYYDDKDEVIPAIGLQVCLHPDLNLNNNKIVFIIIENLQTYHLFNILAVYDFKIGSKFENVIIYIKLRTKTRI